MSDKHITERLKDIECRALRATPGPWQSIRPEGKHYGTEIINPVGRMKLWGFGKQKYKPSVRDPYHGEEDFDSTHYEDEQDYEDSMFIAQAREDIPWLLALVSGLQAKLDEHERFIQP